MRVAVNCLLHRREGESTAVSETSFGKLNKMTPGLLISFVKELRHKSAIIPIISSDIWRVERLSTSLQAKVSDFDMASFVCLRFQTNNQHKRQEFMAFDV